MIDPIKVDGYESNDSEYAAQLWEYHRNYLTADEVLDLVADSFAQSGIEALEREALDGMSRSLTEYRPPARSNSAYIAMLRQHLIDMPDRLALHAWESELEMWDRGMHIRCQTLLAVLELGEEMFDVDLTDEVVDVLEHMNECETKLDQLEARGAIDGDEWYDRHEALNDDKNEVEA